MNKAETGTIMLVILITWTPAPAASIPLALVCELTSEETSSVRIQLTERTAGSLKGELLQNDRVLGVFQSGKPKPGKDPWWSFQKDENSSAGITVFFKGTELWNPYRQQPKPQDSNRVLFAGLASALWNWKTTEKQSVFRGNIALLKAAAGLWSISSQCAGGKIVEG